MKLNEYTTLSRSGLRVSLLTLGTMTFANERWGSDDATSRADSSQGSRLEVLKDANNPAFKKFTERNYQILEVLQEVAKEIGPSGGAGRAKLGDPAARSYFDDDRRH